MTDKIECQTCAFWQSAINTPAHIPEADRYGQCRRFPPVNHLSDKGLKSLWPTTMPWHWCGEHGAIVKTEASADGR